MKIRLIYVIICLILLPASAFADIAAGEALFQSTKIGTNGKSCNSCHDKGYGLENVKDYDSETLRGLINICIEDAPKRKTLD